MKKKFLKKIADFIRDCLYSDECFSFSAWYELALDIIETKLFVEQLTPLKKIIRKLKCTLNFVNKGLDFINFSKILRNNVNSSTCPIHINEDEVPMISSSLTKPKRSKKFNLK